MADGDGRHRRSDRLGLAGGILLFAWASAVEAGGQPLPHVVGGTPQAQALLSTAARRSTLVAEILGTLDRSDLRVVVEVGRFLSLDTGCLHFVAAIPARRYVRVRVSITLKPDEQIGWLAHELWHAFEVAAAPEVRSEAALAALYRRIGVERERGRFYETPGACDFQARVRWQLTHPSERAAPRTPGR